MGINKKNYEGDIPFGIVTYYVNYPVDKTEIKYREQQSWEHQWKDNGFERKSNCQFFAQLEFLSVSRGRSAANFEGVLHEVDGVGDEMNFFLEGCHVNIFMTDMIDIVKNTSINQGMTHTRLWTFCKRGSNYGLRLVENGN